MFFFSQISYLMATFCTSHFHVCCLSLFFVFTCNLLPRGWVLNDFLHLLVCYWFSQLLAWWQFFSSHFHACCLLVDLVFWIFFLCNLLLEAWAFAVFHLLACYGFQSNVFFLAIFSTGFIVSTLIIGWSNLFQFHACCLLLGKFLFYFLACCLF